MGKSSYSDKEREYLIQSRKDGVGYKEIAEKLGRTRGAVAAYHKYITKKNRKKPGPKRRVKDFMPSAPTITATKRPMVAFIGEHTEIVAAIRELFT